MMLQLLIVWTSLLAVKFSFTDSFIDFDIPDNPSVVYTYNRFHDIKKNAVLFLHLILI